MDGSGSAPVGTAVSVGRAAPLHHFFAEAVQYRAKVQRYTHCPEEVTVQRIDFGPDQKRYLDAASHGLSNVPRPRRALRDPDAPRDAESLQRSERRAKSQVRRLVMELAPSALVTFTTRQVLSLDQLLVAWKRLQRLMRELGVSFEYVAVPERHPSNPAHLHVHAAVRGRVNISTLRRLWHIALASINGERVACILKGKASPGNIDVQHIKGRDQLRRIRRIARYVSKYITKDLIVEFNRRRYWPSQGITLQDAAVFWLHSLDQLEAVREACALVGHVDANGDPIYNPFLPCERVAWWAADAVPK
jgi:hypothetical protein